MEESMNNYIIESKEYSLKLLDKYETLYTDVFNKNNQFSKIILIGSGSSYNAGLAVKPIIESYFGLDIITIYSYEFVKKPIICDNALYVFVSQTGNSKETCHACEIVKSRNIETVGVTANLNSKLAISVDYTFDMACGIETVPFKTKGFTLSMLNIVLLALKMKSLNDNKFDVNKHINKLSMAIKNFDNIYKYSVLWFDSHKSIKNKDLLILTADIQKCGLLKEARLKLLECSLKVVLDFDSEEFWHGPQRLLRTYKDNSVIFFIDNKDDEKMKYSEDRFLNKENGEEYYFISDEAKYGSNIVLPIVSKDYYDVFEYIIFFQYLSCKLLHELSMNN